jgi:hypothetical protein
MTQDSGRCGAEAKIFHSGVNCFTLKPRPAVGGAATMKRLPANRRRQQARIGAQGGGCPPLYKKDDTLLVKNCSRCEVSSKFLNTSNFFAAFFLRGFKTPRGVGN